VTDQSFITCLWFDTQAEEAATFYTGIFKDAKLGRVHRRTQAGPGPEGSVMLVEFELNGQKFSGLNGGPQYTFNEAVSIVVPCADQAEVELLLEQPGRGRSGDRLRLAEGQVRPVLADRPHGVLRDDRRPGRGQGGPGHPGDVRPDQVRHRRTPAGLRERLSQPRSDR
jgi:hypothetical protein